jgi:hypothetical protein
VWPGKCFGAKDYLMRIWINPEKWLLMYCSKRYSAALQEQNVEAAPENFGENADGVF